ncbi:acyltransferase family protein [Corynebacterium kefirresidentii]|uniref:Acyltransferase family protein n=1 Tax=Corynebacterium kefirresidentii TaxID=1979527 RepID=A0ABT8Q5C7_9CORY|nr:acyltransferase family protein [Corynebacterium kefirresidentii]MDN8620473.1 acyltransferase family protein [Corynebacterium kefirresidentii]MDN8642356.1 acyltransferase family protein [Corynebacterium kefirresidentii]
MKQILRSLLGKKKPGRSDEPRPSVYQSVKPKAGSTSTSRPSENKASAPQKSDNTESTTGPKPTMPQGKSKDQAKEKPTKAPEAKPAAEGTPRPSTAKPHASQTNSAQPQQVKRSAQTPAAKEPKAKPATQKSAPKPAGAKQDAPGVSPKAATKKQAESRAPEKKPQRNAHEPVQRPRRGANFSTPPSQAASKNDSARGASPKPAAKPSRQETGRPSQQARPATQKPAQPPKPSTPPSAKKASQKAAAPRSSATEAKTVSKPAAQQKSQPQQPKPATTKPSPSKQQTHKPGPQKRVQTHPTKEQSKPQPSSPKKKAQPSNRSQPSQGKSSSRTPTAPQQKSAPAASSNAPAPKKGTTAPKPQENTPKGAANAPQKQTKPAQNKSAAKEEKAAPAKPQQGSPSQTNLHKQQPQGQQPRPKESMPQGKAKKATKLRPQVKPNDISRGLARKSQQVGTPTPAQQNPARAAQKSKDKQQPEQPQPKQVKPQAASKGASAKAGKSAAEGAIAGSGAVAATAAEKKRENAQSPQSQQPASDKKKAQAVATQAPAAANKPAPQKAPAGQSEGKSKYPLQKQTKDPEALATPPESKVVKKKRHARLRQVKGLDGLRGLAVIAVVLYHFFPALLPGGYLGVDLFFVLSGFLITSLLVREFRTSGRISLKDFWVRRFRRILPAAVSVLVMCTALVAWIGGDLAVGLRQQFLGTLFFVNNWTQIATSQSYFADNEIQVFAHYWSLAVEEQFYVIWPLLITGIFLISRHKPRRLPILVSTLLALGSAVAMALIFVPGEDPTRVYYGTDTHAFGLLTGAVLSLLMTSTQSNPQADSWAAAGKAESRIAGVIGTLALIGYGAQLFLMPDDAEFTYRGGLFLTSVLGVLMVWGVVREYGPMTPLFRTKVMRWFGQRSFSLYLWHWPVIMMLKALFEGNQNSDKSWILGLVAVPISLLLSEISYQFIENPFRRGGYKKTWNTYWSSRPGFSELRDGFGKTMWPVVPFLVIASVAGVVYGVINSSDKTELEQQLEQLQQQNQSSNNAPAQPNDAAPQPPVAGDADKDDSKNTKTRPMPQGKDITAIGDSVMLASSGALKQRFPQIYVDADVSRHYTAGIQILQQLKDSGKLRNTVFLGFGTNGPAFPDQIKEALDIIGKDRTVVMAVPYGDREWMSQSQQDVLDAAKEYDNVYVADWCGHAQSDPAILYSDGVHPMPERTGEYSDAFYDALQQYSKYDKTVSSQCVPQ